MTSDRYGELGSPLDDRRLPSLLALRCFEAAARLENFSRAAAELHLTHGAVSRAVRLLEDALGQALFERRSQRVFLTDAGRTLARAVGQGLDLMRQAVGELRASARQARRWVLSCEPTLLMRWLIPRWPAFQARHPEIDVHLVAGGGPFSFDSGIDLAIRRDDFPWPKGCHVEPLFAEKVGPVCRPDRMAAWFDGKKTGVVINADAPLLHTRTRPNTWSEWATAAGQSVPDGPEQIFDHFYFSLQAAVAGLGVAIGPWHLVRDDLDSGVLTAPLGFVADGSHYCLLSPQSLQPESPQADLLRWLRTMA
ncbi:LysR family transcriptional regulator [Pseudoxanthomonas winnipegensis]|uniref:LysR family transcriptional regulator n=1 Tax=Pseudoxanthomonas winnipegensis TaxID=2480810 RepID=UPI00257895CD|nr:LysR family transcriptional regulator [Pseudoxanthomonas winnipegensis]WJI17074.1 LysR family transcriptional regulator [Pseudoxanthomonas winnipegensis]